MTDRAALRERPYRAAMVSTRASPRSRGSERNSKPRLGPSGAVTNPSWGTGTFLMRYGYC